MHALPASPPPPDFAEAGKFRPDHPADDVMAGFPDTEMIDFIAIGSERMFARFCLRWIRVAISMAEISSKDRGRAVEVAQRALIRLWETAPVDGNAHPHVGDWLVRLIEQAEAEVDQRARSSSEGAPDALVAKLVSITRTRPQIPPRGWGRRWLRKFLVGDRRIMPGRA